METAIVRKNTMAVTIAKQATIAITFAILYWGLCMLFPNLSTSWLSGFAFAKTIRIANVLRDFVLWNPVTAIGTATGAWAFNITIGKGGIGVFPLSSFLVATMGYVTYFLSKKWGRSYLKDIALIVFYGVTSGALVALQLTTLAMIFQGSVWGELLKTAIILKISSTVGVMLLGYPILLGFERVRNGLRVSK